MFAGAETIAAIVRWLSVVGPSSISLTRSDDAATVWKYFSISSAPARRPSLPRGNPKNVSGEGSGCGDCAARAHDHSASDNRTARARTRHHNKRAISRPSAPPRQLRQRPSPASVSCAAEPRALPDAYRRGPIHLEGGDRTDGGPRA